MCDTYRNAQIPSILSFDAGDESEQQVHDGRGAKMVEELSYEVWLSLEELHHLQKEPPHEFTIQSPGTSMSYHFALAGNEDTHDFGEKWGQQGVECVLPLQEAIDLVHEGLTLRQRIRDLTHIRGQQLTCRVGIPGER